MSLDANLLSALRALGPYLQEVVVVGGWVPHIYAAQLERTGPGGLLTTRDLDLALRRAVSQRQRSIDRLLEQAGFECEFRSRDTPPVTAYVAAVGQADEMEIEFITPAHRSDETAVSIQSDLTAQALRYVEILLERTWTVPLGELTEGELQGKVRLPTPAAYVFHRSLTYRRRRDRVKREKDLYYAFHVVAAFPEWHQWMCTELPALAAECPAWFRQSQANMTEQFGSIGSPGIDVIAHQRPTTAFPGLNDEQFRQYVLATMQIWLEMMDVADASLKA